MKTWYRWAVGVTRIHKFDLSIVSGQEQGIEYMATRIPVSLLLVTFLGVFLLSANAGATEILVPAEYPTIQSGIDAAAPGDTVLVSAGRYVELIRINSGVRLRSETGLADCVTIDGGRLSGVIRCESLEDPCLLEGFTITGGIHYGLYFYDTSAEIRNCLVVENWAGVNGGGVFCRDANLSFQDCVLSGNTSGADGGGLYTTGNSLVAMTRCTISNNTAHENGGGLAVECPATFTDCVIEGNDAHGYGGGVFISDPLGRILVQKLEGCVIAGNRSLDGHGGGLAVEGAPDIDGCKIWGNTTLNGNGGGLYCEGSPQISGCLIVDNTASKSGGGIFCSFSDATVVSSSTIVGNSAAWEGAGIYCQSSNLDLTQSIIAFSKGAEGMYCYGGSSGVSVGLSNIHGNEGGDGICGWDHGSNFAADPLFCDPAAGNYYLDQDSPCLLGADPYYFVIGALGMGDCSVAPVEDPELPETTTAVRLGQNHPNPFNPRTVIPFFLESPGYPVIMVFDLRGRLVVNLMAGEYVEAGQGEVAWNGRDGTGRAVPGGVYFYRLDTGTASLSRRMVLLK
jgi:parallel beta-helix repeat protein